MSHSANGIGTRKRLEYKARLIAAIRECFDDHGFIEVVTPTLISAPAPEEHIEALAVGDGFLRTSPELEMKRLLAEGVGNVYQIGPCFREGEFGRLHRREFTMLEWYHVGADYRELLQFSQNMLRRVAAKLLDSPVREFRGNSLRFDADWEVVSVRDAFARWADETPEEALENGRFEEALVERIEPRLGVERPAALIDYPARLASLSRLKPEDPTLAERWELYLGGVEIANAYGELTDPVELKSRFARFVETRRAGGLTEYPEAKAFMEAMAKGLPDSSGCALGVDRLAMVLTGADDIGEFFME